MESSAYIGYYLRETSPEDLTLRMGGLQTKITCICNNSNLPALGSFYFIDPTNFNARQVQWCYISAGNQEHGVIMSARAREDSYTEGALESVGSVVPKPDLLDWGVDYLTSF